MEFTVFGYEGDEYIKTQKPNSWRWKNETAIHLPDGRVFASYAEAVVANGPQWIEIRVPGAVAQAPIEQDPNAAAYVRSLYLTYFGREPDNTGWNFWTLELINQRKTRAEVAAAFAADNEAHVYAAGQNAQAAADAARRAQQEAEARAAELQAQLNVLNAQVATGATSAADAQAQIAALQTQLAAAQAAAGAAGSAADTHQAAADDLLAQAKSFVSSHKLIVGAAAAAVILMFMGSSNGKKGSWF